MLAILSGNNFSDLDAKVLAKPIEVNIILLFSIHSLPILSHFISLSCCNTFDNVILSYLQEHPNLKYLNLGNNNFGSDAGKLFKDVIGTECMLI